MICFWWAALDRHLEVRQMKQTLDAQLRIGHDHNFLGVGHEKNERKTWGVIWLCAVMMIVEIIGGSIFGSLALVADGLHMSTHASALLIAALAYRYARKHTNDRRFVFGTGKLGDLAGFSSAIILAMIAILIGYEAVMRFLSPVPIHFSEAIPIAVLGLFVNVASVWLLSGADHGHSHDHHHGHADKEEDHAADSQRIQTPRGTLTLSIFEQGVPPVFRIRSSDSALPAEAMSVTTERPDGTRQVFAFTQKLGYAESTRQIPEPHGFKVVLAIPEGQYGAEFKEHDHGHDVDARDHNMRAAYIHVMADAAVSILAIMGLVLAKTFGWTWMDPLAGLIGALVIANWSYGLVRDTGAILVDISPGEGMANKVRTAVESAGDSLVDLHVWRLGPGHFGAVISVVSEVAQRGPGFYHALLRRFEGLSHITVEVIPRH
jgi:cation diffusion facilitator family transporter